MKIVLQTQYTTNERYSIHWTDQPTESEEWMNEKSKIPIISVLTCQTLDIDIIDNQNAMQVCVAMSVVLLVVSMVEP